MSQKPSLPVPEMSPWGVMVTLLVPAPKAKSVNLPVAIVLILMGISFVGYRMPVGFYNMFDFPGPMDSEVLLDYTSTVGALLVMIGAVAWIAGRQEKAGGFPGVGG